MTLADTAYDSLRRDIMRGHLPPGQPLRLEALRSRYDMGFSPLREALNRLQSERLVVSASMKGFIVAPLSLPEMWEAIEARVLVETEALRLSILRGDDVWEAGIVAALHALGLAAARGEPEALEARHAEFHLSLIAACGSGWLLDFARKLSAATERYRAPVLAGDTAPRDVQGEHAALAEAALARRADEAPALLAVHYRRTGERIAARMAA